MLREYNDRAIGDRLFFTRSGCGCDPARHPDPLLTALLLGSSFLCAWALARGSSRPARQTVLATLLRGAALGRVPFGAVGRTLRTAVPARALRRPARGSSCGATADRPRRCRGRATESPASSASPFPLRKLWAWGPFALLAALVAARGIFLPPLAHDALSYHLAKAAMWIQTGGVNDLAAPGGWSFYRLFPGGWEELLAVVMLPARADAAAAALDVAVWLGLGWAAWETARALGAARGPAAGAAAVFALLPCRSGR
ncbi:MAG: hypothetical protein U1F77_03700 [Kiritimatiellia bacterium]